MNSVDLSKTIAPRSDQLNADDLIAGPMTITITQVRGCDGDQPIAVHFEGDNGKPYKPCKSMRRVLVHAWGKEGRDYAGRRLTLFNDPNVQFGGVKTGGIRISHMSHINGPLVVPLTVTRAQRRPYEVKPLKAEVRQAAPQRSRDIEPEVDHDDGAPSVEDWAGALSRSLGSYADVDELREAWTARKDELKAANPELFKACNRAVAERAAEIAEGVS